jgi:hypothetical protein
MQSQDTTAVETMTVLKIGGIITAKTDKLGEVLVELYEQNKMVDAYETKKNGKFKFELYNNHIYTIMLTKGGYHTKKITVDTRVPEDFDDLIDYAFDIELDKKTEELADDRETLLEYPIAIISYDPKQESFIYDKNYTKVLVKELKE